MVNVPNKLILFSIFLFFRVFANSQDGEILLKNSSFESILFPNEEDIIMHSWYNVESKKMFPIRTPQILHLSEYERYGVSKSAIHGENFIGLEVREDKTWGSIGQTLDEYLDTTSCYTFSVYLARSHEYKNTIQINIPQ